MANEQNLKPFPKGVSGNPAGKPKGVQNSKTRLLRLLEFTQCKKPVITTNWSGHTDFLDPQMSILLGGQLTPVHPSVVNDWIIKDSQWFSVDHGQVGHYLRDVFENYKNYTDKAKRQAFYSKTNFSWDKMKNILNEILTKNIPLIPVEVKLKFPKLKKINLPQKEEING